MTSVCLHTWRCHDNHPVQVCTPQHPVHLRRTNRMLCWGERCRRDAWWRQCSPQHGKDLHVQKAFKRQSAVIGRLKRTSFDFNACPYDWTLRADKLQTKGCRGFRTNHTETLQYTIRSYSDVSNQHTKENLYGHRAKSSSLKDSKHSWIVMPFARFCIKSYRDRKPPKLYLVMYSDKGKQLAVDSHQAHSSDGVTHSPHVDRLQIRGLWI